jgi:hypothetical protein
MVACNIRSGHGFTYLRMHGMYIQYMADTAVVPVWGRRH